MQEFSEFFVRHNSKQNALDILHKMGYMTMLEFNEMFHLGASSFEDADDAFEEVLRTKACPKARFIAANPRDPSDRTQWEKYSNGTEIYKLSEVQAWLDSRLEYTEDFCD